MHVQGLWKLQKESEKGGYNLYEVKWKVKDLE